MNVWVVGQIINTDDGMVWEFQGVFSTEPKAVAACKGLYWFVGPAVMDEEHPVETEPWDGCYYPLEGK